MADRYWVGGSGSWNSTSKWSTTSGGASGASVPTSADNAIFDTASGTGHFVVTVTTDATCADLTITPENVDGVTTFSIATGFVIAGTFSTSGTAGNRRILFQSSTYGLIRDVSIATIGTVTDVDFRDIRIIGAGGTLTGTRIGDLGGLINITPSTPKTVYWVTAGGGNWSGNNWSDSIGGAASTDFFPLAQDTASFQDTGLNTSATVSWDAAIQYAGTVDMGSRTNAMFLALLSSTNNVYGSWTNGSGTTLSGNRTLTFSGRNTTQTITSAGKSFSGGLTIDAYGSTVELGDALSSPSRTLTFTNGGFDTNGYSVDCGNIIRSVDNPFTANFGSSTITLSGNLTLNGAQNLTLDAGTSTINSTGTGNVSIQAAVSLYDVSFTGTAGAVNLGLSITLSGSVRNLTLSAPASAGVRQYTITSSTGLTVTGTLSAIGGSAVRRIEIIGSVQGTAAAVTAGTLTASDCDFRDITLLGAAAGTSVTRGGDMGGNTGIVFPAPKTVYWNLAGSQDWTATGWCDASAGTPDINQFPLPQDTAVFDDAGAVGTVTVTNSIKTGTVDMSARTSAMTFSLSSTLRVYGSWKYGTGVTHTSSSQPLSFEGRGTNTITSSGVTCGSAVTIDAFGGTVQLSDAFSQDSARSFAVSRGTFDAASYNITVGFFDSSQSQVRTLKLGSGTWTLAGTGTVWNFGFSASSELTFDRGTADIVLSNTTTTSRTFSGGTRGYGKVTIGGATGTSTLTISGNNTFEELASTKTVAHTIALGSTTQTFGKWSVTGTSGNVVTLTGTGTDHRISGSCTSGIDYLALGTIRFGANSPGEFYAGANSTASATPDAPTYLTDKPADSTRYWVGGTGDWNDTNKWSTTSGGGGGASLPRSHDDVVFDSSSDASDYTVTVNAITGGNRCKALTISGPASGNVTFAGTTALIVHDDITLPASGLVRTYTGTITLSGSTSGKTITTNGVDLDSSVNVYGVGCVWTLGSALVVGSSRTVTLTNGTLALGSYSLTANDFNSSNSVGPARTLDLGSGTLTLSGGAGLNLGSGTSGEALTGLAKLTVSAGTSQINLTSNATTVTFFGGGKTFYNVSFTSSDLKTVSIAAANTFNNLTVAGRSSAGVAQVTFAADQVISGTLTISPGANATCRTFLLNSILSIGTVARTLTCGAVAPLTDVDFMDITIAGAAVSGGNITGTRLGDCKGNSGITFPAPKTVYWNSSTTLWHGNGWAATSGGIPDYVYFPLAQDTAVIEAASPADEAVIQINSGYNVGTLDTSARVLGSSLQVDVTTTMFVYGDWLNGSAVQVRSTGAAGNMYFSGRGAQVISGGTFYPQVSIITPGGSVTLQGALEIVSSSSSALWVQSGAFDAASYNVTLSAGGLNGASSRTRTLALGSGTWTIAGSSTSFSVGTSLAEKTSLTLTGTCLIRMTSFSAKTFSTNSFGTDLSGVTLDQGGAGSLSVGGVSTLKNISNSYSATGATSILFGTSTTKVYRFTATGEATRVLTLSGSSSTSPCTLVYLGSASEVSGLDYLTITGVRAFPL